MNTKQELLEAAVALAKADCYLDFASSRNSDDIRNKVKSLREKVLDVERSTFEMLRELCGE